MLALNSRSAEGVSSLQSSVFLVDTQKRDGRCLYDHEVFPTGEITEDYTSSFSTSPQFCLMVTEPRIQLEVLEARIIPVQETVLISEFLAA